MIRDRARRARRRLLAPLLLLLFLLPVTAGSAAIDSKGTDFWLAFNSNLGVPALTLFVTGDAATSGTVAIPGLSFTASFSVTPGTVTSVPVPSGAMLNTSDGVESKGIHVTAGAEVTVYGLNRVQFTTDAYLGLPVDALGTEYINLGYRSVSAPSQLGVVASANDTAVTITPSDTVGSRAAGVPYTISLQQGDAYQLQGGTDLSGTIITSTKPVAVFGGAECTNIPPSATACDHVVEQLPPTSAWGKSFVSMPLATRLKGDTFRILASTNGTTVRVNGQPVATLARGQFHEQIVLGPAHITADQPVLVMQYSNGTSFDGVTSDPFQMMIPPFEQYLPSYTITTPASGFATNFVNVVAPTAAVGQITLDGTAIPATSFTAIGSSGFSGTQVPVGLGAHRLVGPLPFGVHTYGFASFDSYGYPGGLSVSAVATVTSVALAPATGQASVGSPYCATATVRDQASNPLEGIRVDLVAAGANEASTFGFTNAAGAAQLCYTGTNAGPDTLTARVGSLSATASVTWVEGPVTQPPPPPPPPAAPPPPPPPAPLPPAELSVGVSISPSDPAVGEVATYTITVTNHGPGTANGVTLLHEAPGNTAFVSASASQGSCQGTTNVVCGLGTIGASSAASLRPFASVTVSHSVRFTSAGPASSTVTIGGGEPDPDSGNNRAGTSVTVTATRAPAQQPPPPPPPPPPTTDDGIPNANETVVVRETQGTVRVRLPGTNRYVDLSSLALEELPNGTLVDARNGRFELTVAAANGTTSTTAFSEGISEINQLAPSGPRIAGGDVVPGVTELALAGGDFGKPCQTATQAKAKTKKKKAKRKTTALEQATPRKPVRRLWGNGSGNFRTKGRYSSATVRGTIWLTEDYCNGTLVRVQQGTVAVRDTVKKRTVLVTAGKSYFAEAPAAKPAKAKAKKPKTKRAAAGGSG